MTRRISAFAAFWYDFLVGDDWRVAVGVIAALALTYGLSTTTIPVWWVLPAAVVVLLPLSLWRVARRSHRISGNYLYARHHDGADNCEALLISGCGQTDEDFVEITPQPAWPKVIDIEAEVLQPWGFGDVPAIKAARRERCDPSEEAKSDASQR